MNERVNEWTLTLESEFSASMTTESGNKVGGRNGGSAISRHFTGRTG